MTMAGRNRRWIVAAHATSSVSQANWALEEAEIPCPDLGQILVRAKVLSVDPYMRGRLNEGSGVNVGDVMVGAAVGEVVSSRHPDWEVGDLVECPVFGWQEYAIVSPDLPGELRATPIDGSDSDLCARLSWLGMPGLTAYFAMTEIGRPRPGDTVVVSAAGGAVGQIAGQIALLAGARVVGIAGSDNKLEWCRAVGFDAVLNYRKSSDLATEVAERCPDGVDVFFDGTGGQIHDAVLANLAVGSRVAIVGKVAVADLPASADIGLRSSARLIETRAIVQGFFVYDWWGHRQEATRRLRAWHKAGLLKVQVDVAHDLSEAPAAFLRMMRGESQGKQLVMVRQSA